MYEQVFNFNARPFTNTPYVKHYFPAAAMKQAIGQAAICIQRGSGPVIAIGDVGTGKSLLLAMLSVEHQSMFQIVTIDCARVSSRKDFLQNILFQLGKPFNFDSETELRFAVIESANPTEESPEGMLLLVDDAEALTSDIFEEMRVLTNIVVEGSPQVRLVLAGTKSLDERLTDPTLASFSQRIASRVFLSNLSRDETSAYVAEHIDRVGGNGQTMFPVETAAKLHELTDGCPRLINQVCDFVLILAATRGETIVSAGLIEEAWNDVQSLPMRSGAKSTLDTSTVDNTDQQSDWTVIEFGQLDEDTQEPSNATVYDFENSPVPAETVSDIPPQNQIPPEPEPGIMPEPDLVAEHSVPPSTSETGDQLGIDLDSLQAMQDAANAAQVAGAPQEDSDAEAERLAMEQELNAVFGDPVQSSSPVADEQNPAELEAVQPDISNQVAPNQSTDSTSIVGAVSSAAIASGVLAETENLNVDRTSVPDDAANVAQSALSDVVGHDDQSSQGDPVGDTPILAPQNNPVESEAEAPGLGFVPAFPPADQNSFVPATQPLESVVEFPVEAEVNQDSAEGSAAQTDVPLEIENQNQNLAGEVASIDPENPSQDSASAEDPFKESFASETMVPDQITRESSAHNQNALKLTSADLTHLQPVHNPSPEQIVQNPQVVHPTASQSNPADPADVVQFEATTESSDNEANLEDLAADMQFADPKPSVTPPEGENLHDGGQDSAVQTRGFSILPTSAPETVTSPEVSQQPESLYQPQASQDPPAEPPSDPSTSQKDLISDVPVVAETPMDASQDPDPISSKDSNAITDEISRQADEILARLQKRSREPTELNQEQQILSDIRQQQQFVNESNQSIEQIPASVPIIESNTEEPTRQDDSEMLVVNPNTKPIDKKNEPKTFPMTDSPISSGNAARMDYEKLFDRLRNQTDDNKK